jgi:fumarate reductase flavoprotein subunit
LQHEFFSAPRYIWAHGPGARYPGKPIVDAMLPELEKWQAAGKITVLLRTGVAELRRAPDGAVIGAVTKAEDGSRMFYRARNVLLAAGGCGANPPLFEKLHGKPLYNRNDDTLNQGPYGFNLGEGIELGLAAGGVAHGGEHYTCRNGYVLADRNYPSPPTLTLQLDPGKRPPWEIQVNSLARRFAREDEPSVNARDRALTAQPGMRAWLIFDQAIFDNAPPLSSRPNDQFAAFFDGHPMFSAAMSLDGLARRASLPEAALVETAARYNKGRADGSDAFGRAHMPLPIAQPPFYAIETTGCTIPTYAGLKVDDRLRVVSAAGKPIKGLYAAGDTLGYAAISGSGSVGGSGLTPALTFGRLLGMEFFEI